MVDLIPSGATALELIYDLVNANTPGLTPSVNLFLGYEPPSSPTDTLVYFIDEGATPQSEYTMGTIVAVEHQTVDVIIYGVPTDYVSPKRECQRLRYVIASQQNYVSRGLRLLYAMPKGNVKSLGRDPNNRAVFMASFECFLDPGYQ
jgi:hypothetical protein